MTLTFKLDLDGVKMNQCAKYLSQKSLSSKVIVHRRIDGHTLRTNSSTWTTKVVDNIAKQSFLRKESFSVS